MAEIFSRQTVTIVGIVLVAFALIIVVTGIYLIYNTKRFKKNSKETVGILEKIKPGKNSKMKLVSFKATLNDELMQVQIPLSTQSIKNKNINDSVNLLYNKLNTNEIILKDGIYGSYKRGAIVMIVSLFIMFIALFILGFGVFG